MKKIIVFLLFTFALLNAKSYYGIDIGKDFNTTGYEKETDNTYSRMDCHFDTITVVTRDKKPYQIILTKKFEDDISGIEARPFYEETKKSLDKAYPDDTFSCDTKCHKAIENFSQLLFDQKISCFNKYKDRAMKSINLTIESDKLNDFEVTVFYRVKKDEK